MLFFTYSMQRGQVSCLESGRKDTILQHLAISCCKASSNTCTFSLLLKPACRFPGVHLSSALFAWLMCLRGGRAQKFVSRRHKVAAIFLTSTSNIDRNVYCFSKAMKMANFFAHGPTREQMRLSARVSAAPLPGGSVLQNQHLCLNSISGATDLNHI